MGSGGNFVGPLRSVLNRLCARLVNMDAGGDFNRDRYRRVLHDFVDRLETEQNQDRSPAIPYGCG